MPLVLENAVPTTWPALGKWTPEFLAEHTDKLLDAYEHSQRVFTFYDPEKPLGKIKGIAADLRASHKIVCSRNSMARLSERPFVIIIAARPVHQAVYRARQ